MEAPDIRATYAVQDQQPTLRAKNVPVTAPTDTHPSSDQPYINSLSTPQPHPSTGPHRSSPASFPLAADFTAGSVGVNTPLDAAFIARPAVPDNDVVTLLDGKPVPPPPISAALAAASAGALASPPTISRGLDVSADPFPATDEADPAGVYGVYDPSGAVSYLTEEPYEDTTVTEVTENDVVITTVATAVGTAVAASIALSVTVEEIGEETTYDNAVPTPPGFESQPLLDIAAVAEAANAAVAASTLLVLDSLPAVREITAPSATTLESTSTASYGPAPRPPPPPPEPAPSRPAASMSVPPLRGAMAPTASLSSPSGPATAISGPGLAVSHAEWQEYTSLPARYKTSVEALRSLAAARLMSDHSEAAEHLDVEVTWDVPPIWLQGRDAMRVAVWMAKWAACVQLDPVMVQYKELDSRRTSLRLYLVARVAPHRPWWLPATWLLPQSVSLQATVHVRVSKGPAADGSQDVVTLIDGAIHNAPKLPMLFRLFNGLMMGYLPAATEALWSPLAGLVADPSCRKRATEQPSTTTTVAAATRAGVTSVTDGAKAAVGRAADAVTATTASVKHAAQGAVDAVRDVVHDVAGAVKGGVSAGAEKVVEVTGRAKATVASRG